MEQHTRSDDLAAMVGRRRRRAGGGGGIIPLDAILTELANFPPLDEIIAESGLPLYTDP